VNGLVLQHYQGASTNGPPARHFGEWNRINKQNVGQAQFPALGAQFFSYRTVTKEHKGNVISASQTIRSPEYQRKTLGVTDQSCVQEY
jgi:hypothetical protein